MSRARSKTPVSASSPHRTANGGPPSSSSSRAKLPPPQSDREKKTTTRSRDELATSSLPSHPHHLLIIITLVTFYLVLEARIFTENWGIARIDEWRRSSPLPARRLTHVEFSFRPSAPNEALFLSSPYALAKIQQLAGAAASSSSLSSRLEKSFGCSSKHSQCDEIIRVYVDEIKTITSGRRYFPTLHRSFNDSPPSATSAAAREEDALIIPIVNHLDCSVYAPPLSDEDRRENSSSSRLRFPGIARRPHHHHHHHLVRLRYSRRLSPMNVLRIPSGHRFECVASGTPAAFLLLTPLAALTRAELLRSVVQRFHNLLTADEERRTIIDVRSKLSNPDYYRDSGCLLDEKLKVARGDLLAFFENVLLGTVFTALRNTSPSSLGEEFSKEDDEERRVASVIRDMRKLEEGVRNTLGLGAKSDPERAKASPDHRKRACIVDVAFALMQRSADNVIPVLVGASLEAKEREVAKLLGTHGAVRSDEELDFL